MSIPTKPPDVFQIAHRQFKAGNLSFDAFGKLNDLFFHRLKKPGDVIDIDTVFLTEPGRPGTEL